MKNVHDRIQKALDAAHDAGSASEEALSLEICAHLDKLAQELMASRPDLDPMSLDEWLAEHDGNLTTEEIKAASAIIDAYYA